MRGKILLYSPDRFSDLPFYRHLGDQAELIPKASKRIGTWGFHLLLGAYFLEQGLSQQLISPLEDDGEDEDDDQDLGEQEVGEEEFLELKLRKNYR